MASNSRSGDVGRARRDVAGEPVAGFTSRAATPSEAAEPAELGSRAHVQRTLARIQTALMHARTRPALYTRELNGPWPAEPTSALWVPPALTAQLRESVDAYARRLRAEGEPAERMLVLVKSAIREATPALLDDAAVRLLTEGLVRRSIEAFYQSPA
jgi:hypothetical protein